MSYGTKKKSNCLLFSFYTRSRITCYESFCAEFYSYNEPKNPILGSRNNIDDF